MDFLLAILIYTMWAIGMIYPFFGAIQLIDAVILYFEKGKQPKHYKALAKYFKMVALYFLGAGLVFGTPLGRTLINQAELFIPIYIFLVPIPIAIYKRRITKQIHFASTEYEILDEPIH